MKPWPIIILSLPGDDERRAPLLKSLDEMGLAYEIFDGVDGRKGLPEKWLGEIDREAARRAFSRDLTDGEFACALSHREIYRMIDDRGLPGAVVLEDDAIVGERFRMFVDQQLYHRAPLMMLDHSWARVSSRASKLMPGVQLRWLALPSCLTTGYSITAEAARNLRSVSQPVRSPADWPGNIVPLGAVALDPRIVDHPDPETGPSHLNAARDQMPKFGSSLQRTFRRLTSWAFWGNSYIKRRSTRIS